MNYSLIKLKYIKVTASYWCLIKTEIAIHTTKLVYGKISNHDNQNALRLMATADHIWNTGIPSPQYLKRGVIPIYHENGTANKAPISKRPCFFMIRPTSDITSELIIPVQPTKMVTSVDSMSAPLPKKYLCFVYSHIDYQFAPSDNYA